MWINVLDVMNETKVTIHFVSNTVLFPYQSFTGADGSSSSHIWSLHSAKEVAGISTGEAMLSPVGASIPPLQDVVIWNEVIVRSQIER